MPPRERDRRLEPRAFGEAITIEFLSPAPHVRDFSTSGLYILATHPLQLGEPVELRLRFDAREPVIVRGMVRRVDPEEGMAIEFTHIEPADRRRIKEFISRTDPKKISAAGPDDF